MWKDISAAWKAAFEAGWESFKSSSIPIGAAICDENGGIICVGRNRVREIRHGNDRIAHAETDCLSQLDTSAFPNVKSYTLYACMEPCPMCMGTFVMSNFRHLRVAARDSHCGAVHYRESDPYIKSKEIEVIFDDGELQFVQLTMQSYFELKLSGDSENAVIACFAETCPEAVMLARKLYKSGALDKFAQSGNSFGEVFDFLLTSKE